MRDHYALLGVSADATLDQIKKAYRAKLREFPAHTHPEEFKQVRAAYDALRQMLKAKSEDFFKEKPLEAKIDPALLEQLKEGAIAQLQVDLDDLLRLTF